MKTTTSLPQIHTQVTIDLRRGDTCPDRLDLDRDRREAGQVFGELVDAPRGSDVVIYVDSDKINCSAVAAIEEHGRGAATIMFSGPAQSASVWTVATIAALNGRNIHDAIIDAQRGDLDD